MGKKGYALVEAVTAVALVMMASGILSLGISFGLRMERRAEQLKDTDTVQEVPARFRMRTWDGTVISGEGCVRRQTVTGRNRELFIYGFGMEPGTRRAGTAVFGSCVFGSEGDRMKGTGDLRWWS